MPRPPFSTQLLALLIVVAILCGLLMAAVWLMLSSALGERDLNQIADALSRYADRAERQHHRGNAELYRGNAIARAAIARH